MTLRPSTRFWVLRRDASRCRYCGTAAPTAEVVVDHVMPSAHGGPDTSDNLTAACVPCNLGKSDSWPDVKIAAEVAAIDTVERTWRAYPFEPRPVDWQHDIALLLQAQIDPHAIEDNIGHVLGTDDWWRIHADLTLDERWPAWNMALANCIEFELGVGQGKWHVYRDDGSSRWPAHRDLLLGGLAELANTGTAGAR